MAVHLDPSDPDQAAALDHLTNDIVGWLTTVSADGTPQSSVVSYVWDGDTILTYSEPRAPKMRNLEANPRVSFHLNSDDHGMHMLSIEGTAAIDPGAPPSDQNVQWMEKYREPYGVWDMDPHETAVRWDTAVRITPTRVRVW